MLGLDLPCPAAAKYWLHGPPNHGIVHSVTGRPLVISGIKELKLKKTTQSGFQGFHRDKYTTIPERTDRVLSAELFCKWSYGECQDIDFDCIWGTVHECVLEAFSGPPDCGEYSPSHQKTVNNIQMLTLARVPQIQEIEVTLNNIYYDVIDLKKFGLTNDKELRIWSNIFKLENYYLYYRCKFN
ncbi:Uricase [Chelonia mydas]|uniref:Uricase n=1 Tax=Chelonia mydas TaxID=8469 RepID=M7AWF6_CHEMY|nr:Uricase [Chelonia mydas]